MRLTGASGLRPMSVLPKGHMITQADIVGSMLHDGWERIDSLLNVTGDVYLAKHTRLVAITRDGRLVLVAA